MQSVIICVPSTLVTFPKQRLCGKEKDISVLGWKELRFKETLLNKIIIPRWTLNYQFELATLGSETLMGQNFNLVAVDDIPEQLRLKYIGHAVREEKVPTQLQCGK